LKIETDGGEISMHTKKSFINLYRAFFPSRELSSGEKPIRDFITTADAMGIEAFDQSVVDIYKVDPNFIEKKIINYITEIENINLDLQYLSLYSQQLNAFSFSNECESVIFADELIQYTMISFFITVFSLVDDKSRENFERCLKNFIVLLDLQGKKNIIGSHNIDDLVYMSMVPTNVMHLAMDTYWTAWTFIISHEIYHLLNKKELSDYDEELEADTYGYRVLMQLISAQKESKVPKEIKVYYEHLYLSPMMLMEYYKLLDFYKELCGEKLTNNTHPNPIKRQEHLFSLFDSLVPENMDTELGNDLYNSFLDVIDLVREQIKTKKERGALNNIL